MRIKSWVSFYLSLAFVFAFLPGFLRAELTPASFGLVDIQSVNPHIEVDLKYATAENFTGQVIYDFRRCFLLEEIALQLGKVQQELEEQGLGLKIWDGYRPVAAQWKLWEIVPIEGYVSNPKKGGRHTRGTAVDLTLVTKEGRELVMPSEFDEFSEKAHRDYKGASEEALRNRALLQRTMEKYGFIGLATEWWHFDYKGWEMWPPLDLDVALLKE